MRSDNSRLDLLQTSHMATPPSFQPPGLGALEKNDAFGTLQRNETVHSFHSGSCRCFHVLSCVLFYCFLVNSFKT